MEMDLARSKRTQMNLHSFLLSFKPHNAPVSLAEKLRSGIAGGIGVLLLALALHYLPQYDYPLLLLAPLASSASLLYAAPHSTFSQPWNLAGGHLVSALCGWMCSWFISDPAIAGGVAVGTAISLTYMLRCLHPPAAATAFLMVSGSAQFHGMGWYWTTWILLANVGISLLLALLINNAIPGRHYPMAASVPSQPEIEHGISVKQADIEWALAQMDSVIDVSMEDLADIYAKAAEHARAHRNSASR